MHTFLFAGTGNSTEALELGEVSVVGRRDALNHDTFSFADARGNSIRTKDALGGLARYQRGAFGAVGVVTDSAGHETRIFTDARGRTESYEDQDTGLTRFRHTAFDELLSRTDQEYRSTVHHYDDVGRLRTVTMREQSGLPETTEFFYDGAVNANAMGRLVGTLSADGHREEYVYEDPPVNAEPLVNRGFVRHVIRTIAAAVDESFVTTLDYTASGQLERVEYPPSVPTGTTPTGNDLLAVHYAYDAVGNLRCAAEHAVTWECEGAWTALGSRSRGLDLGSVAA